MTSRKIDSVAVIGGGTMGMGIAALCASAGSRVVMLDMSKELADKSVERMLAGRSPALHNPGHAKHIITGAIETDLSEIADCDWICEAVIEDLGIKRSVFEKIEAARKDGSIVTTNTSGIPLRSIYAGMSGRLREDIAVTHFFNPVKVMRLLELVPGEDTTPDVIETLAAYCGGTLGKGVVYAKDTVNFIGNRIGCNWMLTGLHKGKEARSKGLNIETMDALMSKPMGLPPTGLYGLIDLVGLDVMALVGENLESNLPVNDSGRNFVKLPGEERAMYERGQLGRKTGGGYYKVSKMADGSKLKEVYEPESDRWRTAENVSLDSSHTKFQSLMNGSDTEGQFIWGVMSNALGYAADLVPDISNDIVNVDRAMRWGFAWAKGPFELIDAYGAGAMTTRFKQEKRPVPKMLAALEKAGTDSFYKDGGTQYFGIDGQYHPAPAE